MSSRYIITTLLGLSSLAAFAQDPVDQARADLNKSVQELGDTRREYSDLRRSLYRDINKLDDEALELGKELRGLDKEEEQRTAKIRSLEREVEARKADFNYASGILNQYSKALVTRLHPAENQTYVSDIEALDQKAASSADDPVEELLERAKVLELGIGRIGSVTGGHQFDGKALRNGSEAVEGSLMLVGPSVFFASKDKEFEGVATFAETGTSLPTVVSIEGSDGLISAALAKGGGELPLDGSMGKAIEVAAANETLMETIKKGGIVGHCILGLGAISLLIAVFKIYEVSSFHVPSRGKLNEILDDLLSGNRDAAIKKAAVIPGKSGDLVLAGVERFHEKRRVLEEAMFEKLVTIKPVLDRFLPFLALTAAAAPLMGLLGTVLGIIKTFKAMALYGTGNAKSFSAGISEALITTAEGLVVAIPVLVIHGMLKSYVKGKFSDVEGVGITLINGTTERPSEKKSQGVADEGDDDIELTPTPI